MQGIQRKGPNMQTLAQAANQGIPHDLQGHGTAQTHGGHGPSPIPTKLIGRFAGVQP